MEIGGKVHCFFEQSGTFKNEFIKLGIPAEDYDIQDDFGQTDCVIDLFAEIEKSYDEKPSIFDGITSDDLIFAFFPCIKFCSVMEQMQHSEFYDSARLKKLNFGTKEYYKKKWNSLRNLSIERFEYYDIILKLFAVVEIRKLRMIVENPWHPVNFTNHFFFMRPTMIDKNRTKRGDYYRKPTAYWFVNCLPTYGESFQPTDPKDIRHITAGSGTIAAKRRREILVGKENVDNSIYVEHTSAGNICDTERSAISPNYARNFICDFVLGKEQSGMIQDYLF